MEAILSLPEGAEIELRAPVFKVYGEDLDFVFTEIRKKGCRHLIVDGKPVDTSHYRYGSQWPLQYVAPPDSGFTLTFDMPTGTHAVLGVWSRTSGVPSVSGLALPARPAGIIPVQYPDITLVYRRIRL